MDRRFELLSKAISVDTAGARTSRDRMTMADPGFGNAAKTALFEAGLELAGVRLQDFAERLLQAADESPGVPSDELVRTAVRAIDGGALAVVADEPELRQRPLRRRVTNVNEAAEDVVFALGLQLLHAERVSGRASAAGEP